MDKKGFTLIELLVVVAIIGILAAVGVVAYNGYTSAAKLNAVKANQKMVINFIMSENENSCRFYISSFQHTNVTYKKLSST